MRTRKSDCTRYSYHLCSQPSTRCRTTSAAYAVVSMVLQDSDISITYFTRPSSVVGVCGRSHPSSLAHGPLCVYVYAVVDTATIGAKLQLGNAPWPPTRTRTCSRLRLHIICPSFLPLPPPSARSAAGTCSFPISPPWLWRHYAYTRGRIQPRGASSTPGAGVGAAHASGRSVHARLQEWRSHHECAYVLDRSMGVGSRPARTISAWSQVCACSQYWSRPDACIYCPRVPPVCVKGA